MEWGNGGRKRNRASKRGRARRDRRNKGVSRGGYEYLGKGVRVPGGKGSELMVETCCFSAPRRARGTGRGATKMGWGGNEVPRMEWARSTWGVFGVHGAGFH